MTEEEFYGRAPGTEFERRNAALQAKARELVELAELKRAATVSIMLVGPNGVKHKVSVHRYVDNVSKGPDKRKRENRDA